MPKRADHRFVEYDQRSETVRSADPPALLDRMVTLFAHLEDRGR